MPEVMTLSEGVVQVIVNLSPVFMTFVVLFVIFAWLRILIDFISGSRF